MDERQSRIKEGAGLDESRINQDFLDLLRKWSTPVLLILAIAAFAFVGYRRMEEARRTRVNDAFQLLDNTVSADSLAQLAEDYSDIGAVPHQARLRMADLYMDSVRGRFRLLAELNPDGTLAGEDDALTAEDREAYLRQARSAYRQVADDTAGKGPQIMLHVGALYGLAAVAESEGQWEDARAQYQQIVDLLEGTAFSSQADVARGRIASLDEVAQREFTIYAAADLPSPATPETQPGELPGGLLDPFGAGEPGEPFDPGVVGPLVPPAPGAGEGGEGEPGEQGEQDPGAGEPAGSGGESGESGTESGGGAGGGSEDPPGQDPPTP